MRPLFFGNRAVLLLFKTHCRNGGPKAQRGAVALALTIALLCTGLAADVRAADGDPAYTVALQGIEDSDLRDSLRNASQLVALAARPPATERALRRRIEDDLPRLRTLLESRGFYDAKLGYDIEKPADGTSRVVIKVETGPAYTLARYDIRSTTPGAPREAMSFDLEKLGVNLGEVADAARIVRAESRILAVLARRAYPLAKVGKRRVVADHAAHTLSVDLPVAFGPRAAFGRLSIEGLADVDQKVVLKQVAWTRGAPFDMRKVDKTRDDLRATGLFSSVQVRHADAVDEKGELPMSITLSERDHRTIGVGASYSSTEGPLARAFWEHRNLFGGGERFKIRGEIGEIREGVFGDLRFPDIGRKDQDVTLDFRATHETPEGFESTETASTLRLERRFAEVWSASAGVGVERSVVEDAGVERDFSLLLLPLALRRDTTDSLLDPSRGGRDELTVTPHFGVLGTDTTFYVARFFDSVHVPLQRDKSLVLAGWARLATILGETTADVPANKRLYAGGAGSVRGYELNSVGPLDSANSPIGGRSSTEFGLELRWRAFESVGFVGFVETGGVYDGQLPDLGKDLQWGAGVGARYYTAIGPLRLDLAFPLNRRSAIDDAFQVLVSLGQAF